MRKLSFYFFVAGMPFNGDSIGKKALGGSETMGLYMASGLAARGHEVTMFCNCEQPGIYQDVIYRHISEFGKRAMDRDNPHDVTVVQRVPEPFTYPLASRIQFWWMHDLALRRYQPQVHGVAWNFDRILTVSNWHKEQLVSVYGIEPKFVFPTRNGIDLDLINSIQGPPQRDMNTLVFTSRPERGMDILLEHIFPRLLQKRPDLKIILAGYENYVEQLAPLYNKIQMLVNRYAGKVKHVGGLSKPDLYRLYKSAAAYTYTTDFEEVSCLTAMETAACGLPFIASHRAALPETCIPEASILIPHDEKDKGALNTTYQNLFVEAVLDLLNNPAKWTAMSEAGIAGAGRYDWRGIAQEWEELAYSLLDESPVDAANAVAV